MIYHASAAAVIVFLFFVGFVLALSFYLGRRAKSERGYFAAAPESCAVTTRAVGVVGYVAAIRLGLGVARHRFGQHSGQRD